MELVSVIPQTFTLSSLVYSHCHCKQRQKICCLRISTFINTDVNVKNYKVLRFEVMMTFLIWEYSNSSIFNLNDCHCKPRSHFIVPIALSELNWAVVLTHWLALQCRSIRQDLIDQLLFRRIVALNPFLVLTFEGWLCLVAMCNWHQSAL